MRGDVEGNPVLEAMKRRRSVRAFTGEPVPQRMVDKLIDAARWAPSAGNLQPWEFYVVADPGVKSRLERAAFGQECVGGAPLVIVVCALPEVSARVYGSRGQQLYSLQDTACATQNILLAAHSLGLGACWVGAFREKAAAEALNLPPGRRAVALIPVGFPSEDPAAPPRKSRDEIVRMIT